MQDNNNQIGSNRINQLRKLSENIPVTNQNISNQINATREMQLQNTIKSAAPTATNQAVQTLGAQQNQQRGQINIQTAEANQKDLSQVAQTGLQNMQMQATQRLGQQGRQISARQRDIENRLASLSTDAKNKILDKQLEFKRDQNNQTYLNERQLADWAIMNAKNEQEFLSYQQQMEQASQRKIQTLEAAYKKIKQTLEHGYIGNKQQMDNDTKLRMKQAANALEEKIQKEYSDFAVRKAMFSAGGAVVGAVVGGYLSGGNPAGAAGGAAVGSGLGTAAAGAT
jgi:hypothetical protein